MAKEHTNDGDHDPNTAAGAVVACDGATADEHLVDGPCESCMPSEDNKVSGAYSEPSDAPDTNNTATKLPLAL